MRYAKIHEGELLFAPHKLPSGDTVVYNPPAALLRELGYKPVTYTDPPETEEGWIPVQGWTETEEEIVQTWTVAAEGDIPDAEALDILLGGEQT